MTNDLASPRIVSVGGHTPHVDPEAFVAAGAQNCGSNSRYLFLVADRDDAATTRRH